MNIVLNKDIFNITKYLNGSQYNIFKYGEMCI